MVAPLFRRSGRKEARSGLSPPPPDVIEDHATWDWAARERLKMARDRSPIVSTDPRLEPLLRRLLPRGTNPSRVSSWRSCPGWPPDLFAVAASALDRLGSYARREFTSAWDEKLFAFRATSAEETIRLGRAWRTTGDVPDEIDKRWRSWVRPADLSTTSALARARSRASDACWLLAVADEASAGIGFAKTNNPREGSDVGVFAPLVFIDQIRLEDRSRDDQPAPILPALPSSVCRMVPASEVCVQPKTNVPSVGITIRSFSHHLALLPSRSIVETEWLFAHPNQEANRPLNLLLVPFPFIMAGTAFETVEACADGRNGYFSVNHSWLDIDGKQISPEDFYAFLVDLVSSAKRECPQVHGIVLPEAALPRDFASEVAELLAKGRKKDGFEELELFISGVTGTPRVGAPASWTFTARLHEDKVLKPWRQKKHHRWRLDAAQVRRYQLGHVLDPKRVWWEKIDVALRTCKFTVIRPGAALAVLVCEDLARTEPVMPAINAVGPNLVIALLMDGPQLESRWSARYATVLADDPGSSVLTLTCRGMIRRSSPPGFRGPDVVGLWKQPDGSATQLLLPDADHGLLICLTSRNEEQFTMDLRSDGGGSVRFELSSVCAVRLADRPGHPWLQTQ